VRKNRNKCAHIAKEELKRESKHCFLCNKCIERYDHHCHWINNCVGDKNKPYFIAFIFLLWLNLVIDCNITTELIMARPNGKIGNYALENKIFKIIYGGMVFINIQSLK